MKVIYYAARVVDKVDRLRWVLEAHLTRQGLEICNDFEGLLECFRLPLSVDVVFVLRVSSRQEMEGMLTFRELMHDRRIILVLPDSDSETVSMAHTLRPRIISYDDSDFVEISSVLFRWAMNDVPKL